MKSYMQHELFKKILPTALFDTERYSDEWPIEILHKQPPIDRETLDKVLNSEKWNLMQMNRFLHFRPVDCNRIYPVATLEWDFSIDPPKLSMRLFLFRDDQFLGFRFESAESPGKANPFFHSQFIRTWKPRGQPPAGQGPSFWPESFPVFPIYASNTVALLVAAMVSLYGQKQVFDQFLGRLIRNGHLRSALSRSPWSSLF